VATGYPNYQPPFPVSGAIVAGGWSIIKLTFEEEVLVVYN
jgi:hypothetical protein